MEKGKFPLFSKDPSFQLGEQIRYLAGFYTLAPADRFQVKEGLRKYEPGIVNCLHAGKKLKLSLPTYYFQTFRQIYNLRFAELDTAVHAYPFDRHAACIFQVPSGFIPLGMESESVIPIDSTMGSQCVVRMSVRAFYAWAGVREAVERHEAFVKKLAREDAARKRERQKTMTAKADNKRNWI